MLYNELILKWKCYPLSWRLVDNEMIHYSYRNYCVLYCVLQLVQSYTIESVACEHSFEQLIITILLLTFTCMFWLGAVFQWARDCDCLNLSHSVCFFRFVLYAYTCIFTGCWWFGCHSSEFIADKDSSLNRPICMCCDSGSTSRAYRMPHTSMINITFGEERRDAVMRQQKRATFAASSSQQTFVFHNRSSRPVANGNAKQQQPPPQYKVLQRPSEFSTPGHQGAPRHSKVCQPPQDTAVSCQQYVLSACVLVHSVV